MLECLWSRTIWSLRIAASENRDHLISEERDGNFASHYFDSCVSQTNCVSFVS